MAEKHWMQKVASTMNKGGLHRALGVPTSKNIPRARIEEATRSKNPRIRKMASLAETFAKARG
jgi:hypothetical protein